MMRCAATLLTFVIPFGIAAAQSHDRAGNSDHIAWYARPSDTGRYVGYYVGGGKPWHILGQNRNREDGTWGWDYRGFCWPSRIMLDWYHGSRYLGGQGAYRTDGPRILDH
jgi:hypothetical protein